MMMHPPPILTIKILLKNVQYDMEEAPDEDTQENNITNDNE